MTNNKEKRINRIIKKINNYQDDVKNIRTMKVGIDLNDKLRKKLDILLDDADEKRQEVLASLMNMFYNNPIDLIEVAGKTINITKNNINVEKVENAISPINGYSIFKNESILKDKNNKEKRSITYFCIKNDDIIFDEENKILYHNTNNEKPKQDIRGIIVKLEKNKKDDSENNKQNFIIDKFSAQNFYNFLYTAYAKGNSYKDYSSARFYENVLFSVAGEVCSFLDKYYTVQNDIQKTIELNLKNKLELNPDIKIIDLPINVRNKNENDEYNKIVKQNNMQVNLAKQQYKKNTKASKDDSYKKEFQLFKTLKGFPSFPLVEKQHEINYSDLNDLLKIHIQEAIDWWNVINNEQMQKAMSHFYNRIVYKLFKYYYNIEDILPDSENHEYELISWQQKYIGEKSPIEVILERIDKKIDKIKKYLEEQKSNGFIDNQNQKELTEWLRGKSLIVFEYLRQRENNFDFIKARSEFDLKSSMNTGIFARDSNKRNKIFEIVGFSSAKKSCILVENTNEVLEKSGLLKNKYSLAFNVSKSNGTFTIDKNGKYEGYLKGKGDQIILEKISFNEEGTFVLPLNFGKRYAREYLYNKYTNFDNLGETLNNARIIKQWSNREKDFKYFVSITFTKLKGKKALSKDINYDAIIGVDRGNILPVAITITDLQGKIIESPEIDVCKDFAEKHREIENLKRQQSSKMGQYDAILKKKAKNFSKATIEKIGAELLYYATKYNALIVLEDLNREFGIKQMMSTNQYTKLEDYLTRKLKENGLMSGDIVVNTRSGLLGKVVAKYTSKTCSHCGFVASAEKLKNVPLILKNENGKDIYYANLDGKEISLDQTYTQYIKSEGHNKIFNANDEIIKLKQKDTKKNQELIEKVLLNVLNPRKTQAEYICPICGHKENADQQASLNIARRWLFKDSEEAKEYKNGKLKYDEAVEKFSKNNKYIWNQNN